MAENSRRTSTWVTTIYLAEGLPYMLVRFLAGVYFTDIGLKESVIGYTNLLGLPWNFKFLWAPLVDFYGTRRGWMVALQLLIGAVTGVIAVLCGFGPHAQGASSQPIARLEWDDLAGAIDRTTGLSHQTIVIAILGALCLLSILSATNDIAIDGYYMEGLPERRAQAAYSGLQKLAYRVAMVFARVVLILFAWTINFGLGAIVMVALGLFHAYFPPRYAGRAAHERPKIFSHFGRAFASYLEQERIGTMLLFILTYKIGDELVFTLGTTFLLREIHLTKPQLSLLAGFIGLFTMAAGALFGAYCIKRWGLKKAMWPLTLGMNLNIWAYVWLAWARPNPATVNGFAMIALTHAYENFARGLGDAVLTVFLIYICKPQFKATHFAIGSALMSVGGNVLGSFSGVIVERVGYVNLYIFSFLCSLPSMALMFRLPMHRLGEESIHAPTPLREDPP